MSGGCRGGAEKGFLGECACLGQHRPFLCLCTPKIARGYRGWKLGVGWKEQGLLVVSQLEGLFLGCFKGPRQQSRCWGASLGMGPAAVGPGGDADLRLGPRELAGHRAKQIFPWGRDKPDAVSNHSLLPSVPASSRHQSGW